MGGDSFPGYNADNYEGGEANVTFAMFDDDQVLFLVVLAAQDLEEELWCQWKRL